jgi:hypothetical protein
MSQITHTSYPQGAYATTASHPVSLTLTMTLRPTRIASRARARWAPSAPIRVPSPTPGGGSRGANVGSPAPRTAPGFLGLSPAPPKSGAFRACARDARLRALRPAPVQARAVVGPLALLNDKWEGNVFDVPFPRIKNMCGVGVSSSLTQALSARARARRARGGSAPPGLPFRAGRNTRNGMFLFWDGERQ